MANKGLGMAADRDSANRGAAIGAAAGGVLGAGEYLFGSQKKKQQQEPNYAGWGITP
jgi:hypothetical protein